MRAAARTAGHRELELAAYSCGFLASVERGELVEAAATLCTYEQLAEQLRVPRYRWRAFFYRTNLLLLEGRFADAEARAAQTIADERRFTPGDAGLVGGTQLLTIYREQGRLDTVEPIVSGFAARFPRAAAWRATRALTLAELGRADEARSEIDGLLEGDFAAIPLNLNRLSGLVFLADASALVGHAPAARRLYALLVPYLPRNVVVGAGVACWGALDLFVGRLAATAGRPADAVRHLQAALAANTRMGARPWTAWAEYELARAYAVRAGRRDRERTRQHLARAQALAAGLAMRRLSERIAVA
jgi:tetratricopeptide (TPR) repeat protein